MKVINQDLFTDLANKKYANPKYNLNNFYREITDIDEIIIHCTATDSAAWDNPVA